MLDFVIVFVLGLFNKVGEDDVNEDDEEEEGGNKEILDIIDLLFLLECLFMED